MDTVQTPPRQVLPLSRTVFPMVAVIAFIGVMLHMTAPYAEGIGLIWDTLFHFDASNYQHLITQLTYLPRLSMALLCGFALAVAGCVMQFVLRNPIASPTTLGVAAGAEFGIILGMFLCRYNGVSQALFRPSWADAWRPD